MDLKKRIEEISAVRAQYAEIVSLRIAVDNANKKYRDALNSAKRLNGRVENENDQRRITMLENSMKRLQNKLAEANTKFTEAKGKLQTEVLAEVNQELSSYREKGDELSQEEAGKRWGMSTPGATSIDAQNYDNRQRVYQIEEAKAKNEERYAELDKQLKEAQAKGDLDAVRTLSEEIGKVQADIRVAESLIAQASVPYKSMEDNQAEYEALFELKTAMENVQSVNVGSKYYTEQAFDNAVKAVEGLGEAIEENIPAEERYASLKGKKAEATKNKVNAKRLIQSLKDKLAKGEIGKDYVDSVRARIEEIKGEVATYEAQEKEYAEKMQKLEEKYNLKPEPTAMEQYEQMQAKYDQLKAVMKTKQEDLAKVEEELAKDPDNAELKAKQEALKTDISKLEAGGKTCEEKLAEYKKLLGLDDKDKGEGDKGEGDKGEGDKGEGDKGEGDKGEGDKGEGDKGEGDKGEGDKGEGDKGEGDKGEGDKGEGDKGEGDKGEGDKGEGDKGKGDKGKGDKGKGEGTEGKVSASDYYDALGVADKHATKVQAWEKLKGKKANIFTKAFMWLPRPGMKKLSEQYLEEGYMDPLYDDIKLLGKGEEPKPVPTPKPEDKKTEKEEKKSWDVDDKTKDKVKQAEQDAKVQAEIEALIATLPEDQKEAVKKAMEDSMLKGKKEQKPAPDKSGDDRGEK